ncbi:LamG domain-containing protein [Gammaproteobacteria bacterium]|nr:LamG domain-containing protein [Gammaproteobacteria bacterium]
MRYKTLFLLSLIAVSGLSAAIIIRVAPAGGASNTLLTNILYYWEFDETGDDWIEEVTGGSTYDLDSASGTIVSGTGIIGNGAHFDKADTAFLNSNSGSNVGTAISTSTYSVSFWVNLDNETEDHEMLRLSDSFVSYDNTNDELDFGARAGLVASVTSASTYLTAGSFNHIVCTRSDVADSNQIWIDGVLRYSDTDTTDGSAVGVFLRVGRDNSVYMSGIIDELGIWDEQLDGGSVSVGNSATGDTDIDFLWNDGNALSHVDFD